MFLVLLEKERLKRGWTQKEVANRIGVARPTYANYERGKREPDFETAQKLADLFETTIDHLLGQTDNLKDHRSPERTDMDKQRIEEFAKLPPEIQERVLQLMREILNEGK